MADKDKKVVNIRERDTYSVEEALEFVRGQLEHSDVKRILIIYFDQDAGLCFACGSEGRDYTVADVNWDLDKFKLDNLLDNHTLISE